MRGAYLLRSSAGLSIHSSILPKIYFLPTFACAMAWRRMFSSMPLILISIWMAVMPFSVPATLKSISPRKSSSPWISVRMATLSDSVSLISPMAMPATGALMGTPASISARVEPQTLPCEVEPLELKTSLTILMAYGNSSTEGITGSSARSARAPWPISRRPGLLIGLASPEA